MNKRIAALMLAMILLLTGCGTVEDYDVWQTELYYRDMALMNYEAMEYQRPNMTQHDEILAESCRLAAEGERLTQVLNGIYDYYDFYDDFYTNYALAYIRSCTDLTDIYWDQEYTYCAEYTATVDAGLDSLYHALADSPFREELESPEYFGMGFFAAYDGESIWDETFTALMEQETGLINQYYDLSAQALEIGEFSDEYYETYGSKMAELYADLVLLRQRIAAYLGYESYNQFAYDFYYYRDYTPEQVSAYLEEIRTELVPLYVELDSTLWEAGYAYCTEEETYEYLRDCVQNMGGMVESAFGMLDNYGLYDIRYSENKYNASFEMYLQTYQQPFIFMNSQRSAMDKLTLVHEFGHFANEYACFGSYAGIDVAEIYSQALEYLSLGYADGGEELTRYKMADSLCIYVEQAAYAAFEHQVYDLPAGQVNAENIRALFEQTGKAYGFDSWGFDPRCFVDITHFYTNPQYIISYVVSNDAAFQIYQLELEQEGAGLELYQDSLSGQESYFLSFLNSAGLEDPFTPGRIQTIRKTLEEILK